MIGSRIAVEDTGKGMDTHGWGSVKGHHTFAHRLKETLKSLAENNTQLSLPTFHNPADMGFFLFKI